MARLFPLLLLSVKQFSFNTLVVIETMVYIKLPNYVLVPLILFHWILINLTQRFAYSLMKQSYVLFFGYTNKGKNFLFLP